MALGGTMLLANLVPLLLAGGRPRTAAPLTTLLYWAANTALVGVLGSALGVHPVGWVAVAAALAAASLALRDWNAPARATFGAYLLTAGLYLWYVGELTFLAGLAPLAAIIAAVLLFLELLALSLAAVYMYETFDALCRVRWRRLPPPTPYADDDAPFVSIHVPAYSEPPDLLRETLDALAALDYPRFEVIVVDNNTKDESLWLPVQEHCAGLGERFRFFHVDPLDGFKAGACNLALRHTDPRATVVGIVDADYVVEPAFLREVVPHLRDPQVAFVQTPQDYREFVGNRYLTDCLHAYAYFFRVSMVARSEHNAAIFGGTMGLIRRSALEEIGGWDEWCITEDAEASLRLLQLGYRGVYIPTTYGRGLMPFDFDGYKKQRFRWCFGGIQILRKHWSALAPFWRRPAGDRLTRAQRAWYLGAALQWLGEPLQLAFAAFLVVGGLAYATGIAISRPLVEAVLIFPLLFLATALLRFLWSLRIALRIPLSEALGAAVSMFSLSWVVSHACIAALVRPSAAFLRTSKVRTRASLLRALQATRYESAAAIACAGAGLLAVAGGASGLGAALALLCFWQAAYYSSAFVTSLSAIRSAAADERPERYRRRRERPTGRGLGLRSATAVAASAAVFLLMAGVTNAPPLAVEFTRAQGGRDTLLPPLIAPNPLRMEIPAAPPAATPPAPASPGAPPTTAPPAASPTTPPATPSPAPTPPAATPTPQPTPATAAPTPPAPVTPALPTSEPGAPVPTPSPAGRTPRLPRQPRPRGERCPRP
ncbi:MAG TPA: glycosyltransferase [Planctomycetota bacterium]|nr:glycosyltransferase [Planctomycetota bacterium]